MAAKTRRIAHPRTGRYVPQPGGYDAFVPEPLPPTDLRIDAGLQGLLSKADLAVGRLDGSVALVPDPDRFVFMYVRREAVLSSQIEGTHASLMDVLEYEALQEQAEARVDVREILNYIAAMNHGLGRLSDLPLGRRLLCEVHAVLMKDVRGGEPGKTPGKFRKSQNWIGGASPSSARFVPPPAEEVDRVFGDLERFIHDEKQPMPALVKAGLIHAHFETIHPFLDGNGRSGRLLITFWLMNQRILRRPLLYTSLFFKENRNEYVDRLQDIRDNGDWEGWLEFFLDGVAQVAEEAMVTAMNILELRDRHRAVIGNKLGRRAPRGFELLEALFKQPVVDGRLVEFVLDVSQPTASAFLHEFEEIGILEEVTGRQRGRIFAYSDYLRLFPGSERRD